MLRMMMFIECEAEGNRRCLNGIENLRAYKMSRRKTMSEVFFPGKQISGEISHVAMTKRNPWRECQNEAGSSYVFVDHVGGY